MDKRFLTTATKTDQISEDQGKFKNRVSKQENTRDEDEGEESDYMYINVLGLNFIGHVVRFSPYSGDKI